MLTLCASTGSRISGRAAIEKGKDAILVHLWHIQIGLGGRSELCQSFWMMNIASLSSALPQTAPLYQTPFIELCSFELTFFIVSY
jgi:hypothetical protein